MKETRIQKVFDNVNERQLSNFNLNNIDGEVDEMKSERIRIAAYRKVGLPLLTKKEEVIINKTDRKRIFKFKPATAIACCLLLMLGASIIAYAAGWLGKIMVNDNELPALSEMYVHEANNLPSSNPDNKESFGSYQELQDKLGIKLLNTKLADKNPYALVTCSSDNENWVNVKITAYIVGDVQNILKVDKKYYNYTSGDKYYSPIDLEIDIITSDSQKETGWDRDFLGYYEFVETYTTNQGIIVNIIKDSIDANQTVDKTIYREKYAAVFVYDGIRYILSGRVSIDTMKEILNSMSY